MTKMRTNGNRKGVKMKEMFIPLAALWAFALGWVVPFATGLLSKCSWAAWKKAGITVILSGVLGFITVIASGNIDLTWVNTGTIVSLALSAAALSFWGIVRNVPGLKDWLYSIGIKDKSDAKSKTTKKVISR